MSRIAVIMGSASDWETLQHSASTLDEFNVPYEVRVISARTLGSAAALRRI